MLMEVVPVLGIAIAILALAVALSNIVLRAHRADRAAAQGPHIGDLPPQSPLPPPVRRPVGDTLPLSARRQAAVLAPRPEERIQVAEPLLEADPARAAGFYREVSDLLRAQLEINPGRMDLRRKLLEVCSASGEAEAFVQCARAYLEQRKGNAPDPHWSEIARMGRELLPHHELFAEADPGRPTSRFQRFYEAVNQTHLHEALAEVEAAYDAARRDASFLTTLHQAMADTVRRPTPLSSLPLLPEGRGGATVYAKREDNRGPDDEQLINALGQALLAQRLGRRQVVTAAQDAVHGLAVASIAARLGLGCTIFMDEASHRRHYARTLQMQRLGAAVRPVPLGGNDAAPLLAALEAWLADTSGVHYLSSLAAGPHPFPMIVRDFQSIVGREALAQLRAGGDRPLRAVVAGMADGYVGLGLLNAFLGEDGVALYCVETPGTDRPRQLREHGWLRASGRVSYVGATDDEAIDVVETLFRTTGICVPTEAARTLACARRLAAAADDGIVLCLLARSEERAATP